MQRNRAQFQNRHHHADPLHLMQQTALQEDLLEHLTTAVHGEARDVPQEASRRVFPAAVPVSVQREASSAVLTAVRSAATAHCLCCSTRDAHMVSLTFNTGDQLFERRIGTDGDAMHPDATTTARILQNIRRVCEPCPAAVAAGMLTEPIRRQYDVSGIIPEFSNCVLDPRGVTRGAQVNDAPAVEPNETPVAAAEQSPFNDVSVPEEPLDDFMSIGDGAESVPEFPDFGEPLDAANILIITIQLCPTCHSHFNRVLPSRNPRPPPLAIANVLWIGRVPTRLLEGLPASAQDFCASAFVFTRITVHGASPSAGTASRVITGYTRIFEGVRGGVFRDVARRLDDEEYGFAHLFAASDLTEEEIQRIRNLHLIPVSRLQALNDFLHDSNYLMRQLNIEAPSEGVLRDAVEQSTSVIRLDVHSDELRPQTSENPDGVGQSSILPARTLHRERRPSKLVSTPQRRGRNHVSARQHVSSRAARPPRSTDFPALFSLAGLDLSMSIAARDCRW